MVHPLQKSAFFRQSDETAHKLSPCWEGTQQNGRIGNARWDVEHLPKSETLNPTSLFLLQRVAWSSLSLDLNQHPILSINALIVATYVGSTTHVSL